MLAPHTPHKAQKTRAAGFTLLELLVALAVFSLLMTGAASLTRSAGAASRFHEETLSKLNAFENRERIMTALIGSAVNAGANGQLRFTGNGASIQFVTQSPFEALPAGRYDTVLNITPGQLTVSLTALSDLNISFKSEVACDNCQFLFANKTGVFLPDWRDGFIAPSIVRLEAEGYAIDASPRLMLLGGDNL